MNTKKQYFFPRVPQIVLTVFGICTLLFGCFQESLWFDEAYTVGIVQHNWTELLRISVSDVHPPLYYLMLKLFCEVFGYSLPVMRVFSALGAILLGIVGITHIKPKFGNEWGFWFTFISFTTAAILFYALEIRMYTWAMLFVTLTAFYAFLIYENGGTKKQRALFLVFSVLSAYTHHFALFTVSIINLFFLKRWWKNKETIKLWYKMASVQLLAYIPGALVFLGQILSGGASWISIQWPDVVFDLFAYPFLGDTVANVAKKGSVLYSVLGGVFLLGFLVVTAFLFGLYKKDKEKYRPAICAFAVYFSVVGFTLFVSLFRVIYYIRYTMVIMGLVVFVLAGIMAALKKWQKILVSIGLVALFLIQAFGIFSLVYDPSGRADTDYIDSLIEEGDIFLISDFNAYRITAKYGEHKVYFYNKDKWNIHTAYQALGKDSVVIDELQGSHIDGFKGRVWLAGRDDCYDYLMSKGKCREISSKWINMKYHNGNLEVILVEIY